MTWGGKVSLLRRKLISRGQNQGNRKYQRPKDSARQTRRCGLNAGGADVGGAEANSKHGLTIVAKAHAKIGMIAHLSIIGADDFARPI